jgi:hypothetical protein
LNSQVLADILPRETLRWKLQMLKSASAVSNSRLHAVKAQTLIISRFLFFATTQPIQYTWKLNLLIMFYFCKWQNLLKATEADKSKPIYIYIYKRTTIKTNIYLALSFFVIFWRYMHVQKVYNNVFLYPFLHTMNSNQSNQILFSW